MLALLAISVPTSTAYILPPAFLPPSSLTPSTTRPAFTPPTSLNSRRPPRRYDEDEDYDDDDDTFYDPIASRREGRRAEPRKIAPPTPGFLADLYNRLFWYGLDDEENYIYEEEKKKTVFGGTKGKFNGLNVLGRMREEEFEYEYDEEEYEEYEEEEYDDDADDDEEEEEYDDEDVVPFEIPKPVEKIPEHEPATTASTTTRRRTRSRSSPPPPPPQPTRRRRRPPSQRYATSDAEDWSRAMQRQRQEVRSREERTMTMRSESTLCFAGASPNERVHYVASLAAPYAKNILN